MLKEHLGILESDAPAAVLEALGSREILGLTLGLDVAHGLHPLAARDRFQDAWVEFLEEIAVERPIVMLIEDIHWGEELLLDLLERIVADTSAPLLLLATARPEFLEQRPGWGSRLRGTTVALEALSTDDSVLMLDEMLGGTLPPGLRDVVIQRAEGNPFFVEELLGTLIDRQLLQRRENSWSLAQLPPDFLVPDTVQAVVAARVDLLDPSEKQGLQAASVIGRIFWAGPVYELMTGAEPDLRVLEDRDFIRRRSGSSIAGDREYAIKHALTREVAYAGLSKARRAQMHAAFARWLERIGQGRDEFASLLAHHYAEAVRSEDVDLAWTGREAELAELRARSLSWLRHAAELAVGRMEIEDGLALLHRALDLETDPGQRATLWRQAGRANILKYDGEAFWTAMQESLKGTDDPSTAADVYADLAFQTSLRGGMWKRRPDAGLVKGWIDQALELAEPGTPQRARALLARAYREPEGSEGSAREAAEIADRLGDTELRSFAMDTLSRAAAARGDYDEGYEWARRRLDLVSELTDPDHIGLIYGYSVVAFVAVGRLDEAREIVQAYDEITSTLSPHHRLHAMSDFVYLDSVAGHWESIRHLTSRAESAVEANMATPCALGPVMLLICALAHVHLGNDQEAQRLEHVATDLGMEGYGSMSGPVEVEIAIARSDLAEIERMLGAWSPEGLDDLEGARCAAQRSRGARPTSRHRIGSSRSRGPPDIPRAVRAPRTGVRARGRRADPAGDRAVRGNGSRLARRPDEEVDQPDVAIPPAETVKGAPAIFTYRSSLRR